MCNIGWFNKSYRVVAVAAAGAGPASRLSQIYEWLGDGDYLVVFDECHKAKNCLAKEKSECPV
jgi:hypothetical protein